MRVKVTVQIRDDAGVEHSFETTYATSPDHSVYSGTRHARTPASAVSRAFNTAKKRAATVLGGAATADR